MTECEELLRIINYKIAQTDNEAYIKILEEFKNMVLEVKEKKTVRVYTIK